MMQFFSILILVAFFSQVFCSVQEALVSQILNPILYDNIAAAYGDAGTAWLDLLPSYVENLKVKWKLRNCVAFNNLSNNYVFQAYSELYNTDVVCKIGFDKDSLEQEFKTLKLYDGKASVKVFDFDCQYNALLMQCLIPGSIMREHYSFDDPESVKIAARILKKLHSARVPKEDLSCFPHLKKLIRFLWNEKVSQYIPSDMLKRAQELASHLIATQKKVVLLHGDLHCSNIVFDNQQGWCAVDPKGFIGESAYDVAAFIRSPWVINILEYKNPSKLISSRLDIFAYKLGIARSRLWAWSFVSTVLTICWFCLVGDMTCIDAWIKFARIIESVE